MIFNVKCIETKIKNLDKTKEKMTEIAYLFKYLLIDEFAEKSFFLCSERVTLQFILIHVFINSKGPREF